MQNLPLPLEQQFIKDWLAGVVTDEQLFSQYKNLIKFYISKKVDPRYREDCFQECSIKLFEVARKYDFRPVKFSTFLLSQLQAIVTTTTRECRANDKCLSLDTDITMHYSDNDELSNFPESLIDMPNDSDLDYFSGKLRVAIATLTEQEKLLIMLKYFKELTTPVIAKLMHCPKGSLWNMEVKALRKMKLVICPEREETEREKEKSFWQRVQSINLEDI